MCLGRLACTRAVLELFGGIAVLAKGGMGLQPRSLHGLLCLHAFLSHRVILLWTVRIVGIGSVEVAFMLFFSRAEWPVL